MTALLLSLINYKLKIKYSDWDGNLNKVDIRGDGIKQVFFQDPNGYWIVLILCNAISCTPADFRYSAFVHIFNNSFSIGLTFELTNIKASTAASPTVSSNFMTTLQPDIPNNFSPSEKNLQNICETEKLHIYLQPISFII